MPADANETMMACSLDPSINKVRKLICEKEKKTSKDLFIRLDCLGNLQQVNYKLRNPQT